MFDQAMHHAMINQLNVLMNSIRNAVRETMDGGMGYNGSCYSQLESSAIAAARARNATMAGFGAQLPPFSSVMPSTESYLVPPYIL
jgi:hypothetical protein